MNFETQIEAFARFGSARYRAFRDAPWRLLVGGVLAGAYVGVAIMLIATLGAQTSPDIRPLVMGASFGLALILVVLAGAELFTGYTLYTTISVARRTMKLSDALLVNVWIFAANFLGALILVAIYWLGEGPLTHGDSAEFVQMLAAQKMHYPAQVLLARGALCNWLVCLALWMAYRVDSDAARCIVIAWCLFAFIAAGFEHSVANMTIHFLALAGPINTAVSVGGAAHNLLWVTLGNAIGGGVFVGLAYVAQTITPKLGTAMVVRPSVLGTGNTDSATTDQPSPELIVAKSQKPED